MKVKNLYLLPISKKGQITLPAKVRRLLDLEKKGKVYLKVTDKKKAFINNPGLTLEEAFESVKPINKSFSQIRKIAREERLKKAI